ncbi:DUF397 domain-containing protein [Streptomyces orinoci]|uniref:DUF397 domain-containing protein n=1 Tax=Streptomyces orinoci TaxID=67339 RepID=A0ABV3K6F9_STRON|nr:DUF397 domain-containing protein [Streptomyces orinoci]
MTTESPRWFKSSYSSNGGDCVEIAANLAVASGTVPVRDSKAPQGPALAFPMPSWASFITGVKGGGQPTV